MKLRNIIIIVTAFLMILPSCAHNKNFNLDNDVSYLAKPNHSTLSYDGKYKLVIIQSSEQDIQYWNFQIVNVKSNDIEFTSKDNLRTRDRLLFMWDENRNIVWIYSGDVGIFCCIRDKLWSEFDYERITNKKITISPRFNSAIQENY